MPPHKRSWFSMLMVMLASAGGLLFFVIPNSAGEAEITSARDMALDLPKLPLEIPRPAEDGVIYLPNADGTHAATTLNPALQEQLSTYIQDRGAPVAAVVIAEAATGRILAMAQGRNPESWGASTHSALHNKFPTASLFKTVVTAAAFEVANIDESQPYGLSGGCGHVQPTGIWMNDQLSGRRGAPSGLSLRRAYGMSCNGFYAKLAINQLGLGIITNFARRMGFSSNAVSADFHFEPSQMLPPGAQNSSAFTVGRFAAGFGLVGTSAVHVAWQMLAIANDGVPRPLVLFRNTPIKRFESPEDSEKVRIFSANTARRIRGVMEATIQGGTASFAFKRGKYKRLREIVGGKTGTLTGNSPAGVTTLFSGMMPLAAPEIVVSSIVILENRWIIKAPLLAAEAFSAYYETKSIDQAKLTTAGFKPVAKAQSR